MSWRTGRPMNRWADGQADCQPWEKAWAHVRKTNIPHIICPGCFYFFALRNSFALRCASCASARCSSTSLRDRNFSRPDKTRSS